MKEKKEKKRLKDEEEASREGKTHEEKTRSDGGALQRSLLRGVFPRFSQTRSLSRVRFAVSRLGLDRRGCASYKLELSFATRHAMWSNLAAVKALAVRRAALPPDDPEELDD